MRLKMMMYWTATALIALETFAGGIVDLIHGRTGVFSGPHVTDVLISLGYPAYVLAILGVWKIPGAITLVVPGLRLKEWAYAGIVFDLSAAAVSHAICGHRQEILAPVVLAGVALTSWAFRPPSRVLGARTKARNADSTPIRASAAA
jgi:hypothetical protein